MKGIKPGVLFICLILITIQWASCQINANTQSNQSTGIIPLDVKCPRTQFTSNYTMCEINFDYCNQTKFTFVSCFKKQCQRFIRASDCRLWNRMELSEVKCFKQCCGSQKFNEKSCIEYNGNKQQARQSMNGVIIAVIVVSSVILVGVAAYLLIKVQKCCEKKQSKKISKYNIFWRSQKFLDSTCNICKNYGAAIQTPCKHYFHASCFQQNTKQKSVPLCPTCQQPIKQRLKIGCTGCKQKIFKIKLWKIQYLSEIMRQARALHDQVCSLSTKSDQLLLSPVKY